MVGVVVVVVKRRQKQSIGRVELIVVKTMRLIFYKYHHLSQKFNLRKNQTTDGLTASASRAFTANGIMPSRLCDR